MTEFYFRGPPSAAVWARVFHSIQWLRAAAAMAVVVFHATQRAGAPLIVGAAGVDVFFVISGFVMVTATRARPLWPRSFILNRAIRIVPAYWAVTLAMVALAHAPGAFPTLQPTTRHVLMSLLFIPHDDPAGAPYPVLAAGWTLNVEMAFYLLFAATLCLPARMRLAAMTAVIGVQVVIGWIVRPDNVVAAAYTDPILLEFAAGAWLATAQGRGWLPNGWLACTMLALGLSAFAAQAWLGSAGPPWRVLAWGGPAVLIVAGGVALERRPAGTGWLAKMGLMFGDASYMLYLVHGLVVAVAWRLVPGGGVTALTTSIASSVAAAVLFNRLVEAPATAWLRRAVLPAPRPRLALGPEPG